MVESFHLDERRKEKDEMRKERHLQLLQNDCKCLAGCLSASRLGS